MRTSLAKIYELRITLPLYPPLEGDKGGGKSEFVNLKYLLPLLWEEHVGHIRQTYYFGDVGML